MNAERQNWFPRYRDGKKIIVSINTGEVTSTNPIFMASVPELLTLTLVSSGFRAEDISLLMGQSKSGIDNQMSRLRQRNHAKNGKLFQKARTLDLNNSLALRGLILKMGDCERKKKYEKQIEIVTQALNTDTVQRRKERLFVSLPNDDWADKWLEQKGSPLRRTRKPQSEGSQQSQS